MYQSSVKPPHLTLDLELLKEEYYNTRIGRYRNKKISPIYTLDAIFFTIMLLWSPSLSNRLTSAMLINTNTMSTSERPASCAPLRTMDEILFYDISDEQDLAATEYL